MIEDVLHLHHSTFLPMIKPMDWKDTWPVKTKLKNYYHTLLHKIDSNCEFIFQIRAWFGKNSSPLRDVPLLVL